MKKTVLIFFACLSLYSCGKKENKDKIVGKWRGAYQENPQMEALIKEQMHFIDTVGQTTTPEENLAQYGTNNMDSFKAMQREQIDAYRKEQDQYMKETIFDFRKDGVAVFNFSGTVDSANWYFNDEGALILDEMKLKGAGQKLVMTVLYLNDTALKLKFNENDFSGSVVFHPDKK